MTREPSEEDSRAKPRIEAGAGKTIRSTVSDPFPRSDTSRSSFFASGFRSVMRGEISVGVAAHELLRRGQVIAGRRRERRMLDRIASQPAQLRPEFQSLSRSELTKHFRERTRPHFFLDSINSIKPPDFQHEGFPKNRSACWQPPT